MATTFSLDGPPPAPAEDELLPREELLRRYRNQKVWHRAFAECLDGIPALRCLPGAGMDGCRMPDEIRRIVETLAHYCPVTWEHGYMGRRKEPSAEANRITPPV